MDCKMSYIKAENLTFSYREDQDGNPVNVIDGVSLEIERGEFVAVVGRNGSGKSTLAKLLNLILEPTGGGLTVAGKRIDGELSDEELLDVRRRVGMVFQNPDNQIIATEVDEEIAFGPENLGLPPEEIQARVAEAVAAAGLDGLEKKEPSRLSGGQKQRVAIAGVLAMHPECIIFDESTAMLDPRGRHEVLGIMKRLSRDRGITVIDITHLMEEAAQADRIIVLNRGKVEGEGTPDEVFLNRDLISRAGILPPQSARLLSEVEKRGFPVGKATDPERAASLIADYYFNRR